MSETFDRSVLGHEAVRLLEELLKRVNEVGRTQVPTSVLLGSTKLTQGGLTRARGELVRHQLLRTEPGFSANGLRGPNVYVLNMCLLEPPCAEDPVEPVVPEQRSAPEEVLPASSGPRHARKGWLRSLLSRP
jgi:hypothetical protein